ncbi:hypothetical protein [Aeromonas sanarellii]|uniref:hypothetical protein n=1 Tax=Aeromonas sanarellii TaxID=633415 RepID=UPI0038D10F55
MRLQMRRCCWGLALLIGGGAQGATLNVTAEYNPASYEAEGAKFINTTPCTQFPNVAGFWCSTTATAETPQAVRFDANINRTVKESSDSREGVYYLGFPGARDVTLVKQGGGASYTLKFIVTAIGSQMNVGSVPVDTNITENGDCVYANTWKTSSSLFVYRNVKETASASGGRCHGQNAGSVGKDLNITSFYLGYKLKAPNPLAMENGTYTGQLTLSMGPNQDFDLGAGTYADTQLTVNFTITVRHQIKVEFPAGSNKIVLQPPGGWHDWIYRGKSNIPPYLTAELPYRLWATADFSVRLTCQYQDGEYCALNNIQTGHKARVNVMYRTGALEHVILKPTRTLIVRIPRPAININRSIIFKVDKPTLTEMMQYPGSTYKGDVTLIYDAAI